MAARKKTHKQGRRARKVKDKRDVELWIAVDSEELGMLTRFALATRTMTDKRRAVVRKELNRQLDDDPECLWPMAAWALMENPDAAVVAARLFEVKALSHNWIVVVNGWEEVYFIVKPRLGADSMSENQVAPDGRGGLRFACESRGWSLPILKGVANRFER